MADDRLRGLSVDRKKKTNGPTTIFGKFLKMLKNYCLNTTLHGLRYFVEEDRHIVERLFWLACVAASWVCAVLLVQQAWLAFRYNPINFVVQPAEPGAAVPFPSVIICPMDNHKAMQKFAKSHFNAPKSQVFGLSQYLQEIVYFKGDLSFFQKMCLKRKNFNGPIQMEDFVPTSKCFKDNFTYVVHSPMIPEHTAYQLQMKCEDLLDTCHWNNEEFNCCNSFLPLRTDRGICYAINNVNTWKDGQRPSTALDMTWNRTTKEARLEIKFKKYPSAVWPILIVMPREGIPYLGIPRIKSIEYMKKYTQRYVVTEVYNDDLVPSVDPEVRKCKFSWETDTLKHFKRYSESICILECRKQKELELCGCNTPLMPFAIAGDQAISWRGNPSTVLLNENTKNIYDTEEEEVCNMTGLLCIATHLKSQKLYTLKPKSSNRTDAIYCPCLSGCEEIELELTYDSKEVRKDLGDLAILDISLERAPTLHYKRHVVRGRLDMVVSIGGTLGLFIGASLLSLIEFIHYFVLPFIFGVKDTPTENPTTPIKTTGVTMFNRRVEAQYQRHLGSVPTMFY